MMRVKGHLISNSRAAVASFALALLVFSSGPLHAQTQTPLPGQDFFTNVIQTELRTAGAGDDLPGFNPCGTNGALNAAGTLCTNTETDGLLSGANVINRGAGTNGILGDSDDTLGLGLFSKLGPGAVTDNMFGKVLKPADPGKCGIDGSIGTTTLEGGAGFKGELNCGNVRFEPGTQGQIIPNRGNILTSVMSSNTPIDLPFLSTAPDPLAEHTSKMQNAFVWNPLNSPVLLSTGQQCAAKNPTTMEARVCGFQSLDDTTNLGQTGKETSVTLAASWTTGQTETISAGVLSSAMTNGQPAVTWSSKIVQDEVGGTGGKFEQTTSGSFNYHANTAFPTTQYPTGLSFTNGDAGTILPK